MKWIRRCASLIFIFIFAASVLQGRYLEDSKIRKTIQPDSLEQHDPIRIARATWDTGWFQAEIYRILIEKMGYNVAPAQTMGADQFYSAVSEEDVDFWVNGWFPLHKNVMQNYNKNGEIVPLGSEVRHGAMQGYLVDRESSRELNFTNLRQLQNPEIARHFDADGDGKADLIGCNNGWECKNRIDEHLADLGLEETVEQVQGDYNPLVSQAIEEYRNGAPLLLYTWTPNWTLGEIEPGQDVLWLDVPPASSPDQQDRTSIAQLQDLEGAATTPIRLGFAPNDIRVVANRSFLDEYPDLKVLFEQVEISPEAINRQNARMAEGGGTMWDIRTHAREWINENQEDLAEKMIAAGVDNPFPSDFSSPGTAPASAIDSGEDDPTTLRVVTQQVEPLVLYQNQQYTGFSIEIWQAVAEEAGLEYSLYSVNSIAKMLDDIHRGEAHVATAALGITSDREQRLDFSHPYFDTGLQIMVRERDEGIYTIFSTILSIIFSKEVLFIFLFFFGVMLLSAHIIWFAEREKNEDFPNNYLKGIGVSIWWAAVTVTTVGYGDKTPKGVPGRVFGLIWIFAGYFAFSYFTATLTSTATVQEIEGSISGPGDLSGRDIATVEYSAAEDYLNRNGISRSSYATIDTAIEELKEGNVEAVVYDAPVLQYFASQDEESEVEVVGSLFDEQSYGFAMPRGSALREKINLAFLRLVENDQIGEIRRKWFGSR